MSDHCEVDFWGPAGKALEKVIRADPVSGLMIENAITQVQENGWILSTKSRLIRVLKNKSRIGEIREMGPVGHRLIFFWVETQSAKILYVTAIAKKKDVANKARLNDFIAAAEARRKQFLEEES